MNVFNFFFLFILILVGTQPLTTSTYHLRSLSDIHDKGNEDIRKLYNKFFPVNFFLSLSLRRKMIDFVSTKCQ